MSAEDERAAVVAWLEADAMRIAKIPTTAEFAATHLASVQSRLRAADAIRNGDHITPGGDHAKD